jgi:hypothetical protein
LVWVDPFGAYKLSPKLAKDAADSKIASLAVAAHPAFAPPMKKLLRNMQFACHMYRRVHLLPRRPWGGRINRGMV